MGKKKIKDKFKVNQIILIHSLNFIYIDFFIFMINQTYIYLY